ncbi:MAG: rod shape-determining protein MreC [Myxococcales bacterium]|nr:rod shape-determining protein MreC [Myxococcales bacterium]
MFRSLERLHVPLVLAVTLLLPAALYRSQTREVDARTFLDRSLYAVAAPLQNALLGTVGLFSDTWYHYIDLVNARQNEIQLRRELGQERRRTLMLEALELENEHLRALLELEDVNQDHQLVAAKVVGGGLDPGVEVLRIDRGALNGLKRGFPVLSGEGLVGRVLDVAWTSADIQLLADPRVSVSAKVVRTGARGRLQGAGQGHEFGLVLSEVLRSDDMRLGDQVVTSGRGGIYPEGIPLGVITRVYMKEGVPHRFADVSPFADFARMEFIEVLIQSKPGIPLVTPEPLLPPALRASMEPVTPKVPAKPWPPQAPPEQPVSTEAKAEEKEGTTP